MGAAFSIISVALSISVLAFKGFRVSEFKVLEFRVLEFRVLGFRVLGFRVLGFRVRAVRFGILFLICELFSGIILRAESAHLAFTAWPHSKLKMQTYFLSVETLNPKRV